MQGVNDEEGEEFGDKMLRVYKGGITFFDFVVRSLESEKLFNIDMMIIYVFCHFICLNCE